MLSSSGPVLDDASIPDAEPSGRLIPSISAIGLRNLTSSLSSSLTSPSEDVASTVMSPPAVTTPSNLASVCPPCRERASAPAYLPSSPAFASTFVLLVSVVSALSETFPPAVTRALPPKATSVLERIKVTAMPTAFPASASLAA